MKRYRKVVVYRPSEPCELSEVRKGDIFRILPRDETDANVPKELLCAEEDAKPNRDSSQYGSHEVKTSSLIKDPNFGN